MEPGLLENRNPAPVKMLLLNVYLTPLLWGENRKMAETLVPVWALGQISVLMVPAPPYSSSGEGGGGYVVAPVEGGRLFGSWYQFRTTELGGLFTIQGGLSMYWSKVKFLKRASCSRYGSR